MRLRLFCLVASLVLLAARTPASADEVADLRAELQRRLDAEPTEPLDRAQRRERRLVARALQLLDRTADGSDPVRARSLSVATTALARAFPDEFGSSPASGLGALVDAVVAEVRADTEKDYEELAAAVPAILDVRLHDEAERHRSAARAELDLAPVSPSSALMHLGVAARRIASAQLLVAEDRLDERFSWQFNGRRRLAADDVRVEITEVDGHYVIDAVGTRSQPGDFMEVRWTSADYDPVTGPGTFRGNGTVNFGTSPDAITDRLFRGADRLQIVEMDTTAKTFRARFDWGLSLDGLIIASTQVTGAIVTSNATVR